MLFLCSLRIQSLGLIANRQFVQFFDFFFSFFSNFSTCFTFPSRICVEWTDPVNNHPIFDLISLYTHLSLFSPYNIHFPHWFKHFLFLTKNKNTNHRHSIKQRTQTLPFVIHHFWCSFITTASALNWSFLSLVCSDFIPITLTW